LDLRTLPGGAPARPARLGRLPEITDIPVFSATIQRTAVHHLPLPSRYVRQSRIAEPTLSLPAAGQQQRRATDAAATEKRALRSDEASGTLAQPAGD